ncbi:MAG: FAD-dependent oxidoreductase, partial [Candidatus Competibacteraceae bacterium]|nr:FAD-dependent oxidoreductase [Candidatus Competibacteraceae bacterium]
EIDLDGLRGFKNSVVGQLTGGLSGLAKGRKVQVVRGTGTFTGPNMISVAGEDGTKTVSFDQCIIAAGSEPVALPFLPQGDPRVIDSTGALELADIPGRMLVLGGGIIGLEMACVYDALGSSITVVELMDQIIPGADKDIVKPLMTRIQKRYANIYLKTKVTAVEAVDKAVKETATNAKGETVTVDLAPGLHVTFEGPDGSFTESFDKVLV